MSQKGIIVGGQTPCVEVVEIEAVGLHPAIPKSDYAFHGSGQVMIVGN